jgi:hypothetical protein
MSEDKSDEVLSRLDPERRDFLKKIIVASAFTVPAVASFSMDGLSVYEAHAQNGSNFTQDDDINK